jgi:hypothetical protein
VKLIDSEDEDTVVLRSVVTALKTSPRQLLAFVVYFTAEAKVKFSQSSPRRLVGVLEVYIHAFLNLVCRLRWWSTSPPGRFTAGKEPWYSLNGKLGSSQSRSERFRGEKNLVPLPGFGPRIVQPIA